MDFEDYKNKLHNKEEKEDILTMRAFFYHYYPRILNFVSFLVSDKSTVERISNQMIFNLWNHRSIIKSREDFIFFLEEQTLHFIVKEDLIAP